MLDFIFDEYELNCVNMPELLTSDGKKILQRLLKLGYVPKKRGNENYDSRVRYLGKVLSMPDDMFKKELHNGFAMVTELGRIVCDTPCNLTSEEDSEDILKLLSDKRHYLIVVDGKYQVCDYTPNVNSNEFTKVLLRKLKVDKPRLAKIVECLSECGTVSLKTYNNIKDDLDTLMSKKFIERDLCIGYDERWCCRFGLALLGSSFVIVSVNESKM